MQTIRAQACFKGAAYSQAPLGSSQGKPSVFCPNRSLQFVTEQAQPCDPRHLSCPAHCGNVYAQDQMHPPCLYLCVLLIFNMCSGEICQELQRKEEKGWNKHRLARPLTVPVCSPSYWVAGMQSEWKCEERGGLGGLDEAKSISSLFPRSLNGFFPLCQQRQQHVPECSLCWQKSCRPPAFIFIIKKHFNQCLKLTSQVKGKGYILWY